ncbi:MAG: hypothetical protein ACYST5_02890 [Planctomycetota bacterium]
MESYLVNPPLYLLGKTIRFSKNPAFLVAGRGFLAETVNGTEDIWWILEGRDYPRLTWELIEDGSTVLAENFLAAPGIDY